jgi:hypothetical protein
MMPLIDKDAGRKGDISKVDNVLCIDNAADEQSVFASARSGCYRNLSSALQPECLSLQSMFLPIRSVIADTVVFIKN